MQQAVLEICPFCVVTAAVSLRGMPWALSFGAQSTAEQQISCPASFLRRDSISAHLEGQLSCTDIDPPTRVSKSSPWVAGRLNSVHNRVPKHRDAHVRDGLGSCRLHPRASMCILSISNEAGQSNPHVSLASLSCYLLPSLPRLRK